MRQMANEHGTDTSIARKLARVARIHFSRQRLAAVGPKLPARQDLFNKLLASKAIEKAIEDEAKAKKLRLIKHVKMPLISWKRSPLISLMKRYE